MGSRFLVFILLALAVPVALGLLVAASVGGPNGVVAVALVWLVLLVLFALVGRQMFRTWRPVRHLIAAAGRLAEGDYTARVPTDGPVVTRPVAGSFNRMAERLQTSDEQRRRLLADVGHELRTPLTVIRGDLEAMVDGVRPTDVEHLRALLDDVGVVERLLDDLRTLSLAESGALVLHREPTDVGRLAQDVVASLERPATAAGVSLTVTAAPGLPDADIDPVRVREVLSNLIVNAIGATPDGGAVEVALGHDAPAIVIEVRDTGEGIPPDARDLVFERFHKGARSTGTGLGLTISRDLIEAHGGTIDIAATSEQGTVVVVRLPAG